jgi:putative acyl-CoA dehydrogenase
MLRAFEKEQSLPVLVEYLKGTPAFKASAPTFMDKLTSFENLLGNLQKGSPAAWEAQARNLALLVGDLMSEALVFEHQL